MTGDKKTKASSKKGSAGAGAGAGASGINDRSGALDSNAPMSIMQGLEALMDGTSAPQVDALSNILDNLGMPQLRKSEDSSNLTD